MITGSRAGAVFILCDKAEALYLAWQELRQAAPKATRKASAARKRYFDHRAACTACTPMKGNEKHE